MKSMKELFYPAIAIVAIEFSCCEKEGHICQSLKVNWFYLINTAIWIWKIFFLSLCYFGVYPPIASIGTMA